MKAFSQIYNQINSQKGTALYAHMDTRNHFQRSGFTIVELLIVIVVIGILAAISIVSYNGVQSRTRDAQRASDISQIKKVLLAYNATNGGVPIPKVAYTWPTSEPTYGNWDTSTRSTWLSFLRAEYGNMPVDPKNVNPSTTTTSNPHDDPARVYIYYCYSGNPSMAYVNYRKDSGEVVNSGIKVDSCLTTLP